MKRWLKIVTMSSQCTFFSWNVRGMGTQLKRTQVFTEISKVQAKIICIQETHLDKERHDYLKKPWIPHNLLKRGFPYGALSGDMGMYQGKEGSGCEICFCFCPGTFTAICHHGDI